MRSHRGRTVLTLMGIILGVAVVLAIQITNQTTLDSLRRVFDRTTGQAGLVITPPDDSEQKLNMEMLARLENAPGIQAAAPSIQERTLLARDAGSWQIAFSMTGVAAGNMLQMFGIDPELDPQVRVYILAAGRMPEVEKYEAAIPQKYAAEKGLLLGEDLVILIPDGTVRLEIVGFLADEGVSLLNDGAVAFAPLEVVQDLFGRGDDLDEIALRLDQKINDDPKALDALKQSLEKRVGKEGQVIYPAARGQLVSQMLSTYQFGLTFFSLIAIFVGAFLIYNAFSMTVVERTREIGMLRAIGMNRQGILSMVLAEAVILSLVGSALGLGLGVLLARGLIRLLGDLVTAEQGGISIPIAGFVQSLLVGIGVTLVAALLPAIQAARTSPLEALRMRSRSGERVRKVVWFSGLVLFLVGIVSTYGLQWRDEVVLFAGNFALVCLFLGATLTVTLAVGWLERLARPLAMFLYGNEGAIGSANIHRSVGRTTLTVASLMVALTMIIGINSIAYSFEFDMSNWIDHALGGDLYVRAPIPMRESFALQLQAVPGVEVVTPSRVITVRAAPGHLLSDTGADVRFYFNAIEPFSFRQMGDMEFAANQGDTQANWERFVRGEAVFISSSAADRFDLGQGDELILLTNRGEKAFYVAAEVMDFGGQGQVVYGSYQDLHRWFSEQGVDRFTLSVQDSYAVEKVSDDILRRFESSRHISIQTTEAFKTSILDLMNQSFRLFDVLSLIGVVIGSLGVINTLMMNVMERQREIGGLRSLGMTRSQILRMVLAEALTLGLMGGTYGLAVGYVIAHMMIRGTNMMTGYDLTYRFIAQPFVIGAVIALVVVQIAAVYPAQRAASVNIVEAIKQE